jgi:hypothetical protein
MLCYSYKFGEVTSWQESDLAYIRAAMKLDIPQLDYTGIFPSVEQLEEFSEIVKKANNGTPIDQLSKLMSRFVEAAQLDSKFRLSEHSDMILVSNWLQTIPLSLRDRYSFLFENILIHHYLVLKRLVFRIRRFTFANAPVNTRDSMMMNIVYHYAAHYALKRPVALNVRLPNEPPKDVLQLTDICLKHNIIDLYIWLALRFPDLFVERDAAIALKAIAINMIECGLESEKLHHKFNHSEEYKVTREKELRSNPEMLPPADWGPVREETRKELEAIDPKYMFVFPNDRGGMRIRSPWIRKIATELATSEASNRSKKGPDGNNKKDSKAKTTRASNIMERRLRESSPPRDTTKKTSSDASNSIQASVAIIETNDMTCDSLKEESSRRNLGNVTRLNTPERSRALKSEIQRSSMTHKNSRARGSCAGASSMRDRDTTDVGARLASEGSVSTLSVNMGDGLKIQSDSA